MPGLGQKRGPDPKFICVLQDIYDHVVAISLCFFWGMQSLFCWWFGTIFYFPIYWEQSSQLTIFQCGWNHQPVMQTAGSSVLFDLQKLLTSRPPSIFELPKLLAQPSARFMKPSERWGCRQQTREFSNEHGEQPPTWIVCNPIFWSPNMLTFNNIKSFF